MPTSVPHPVCERQRRIFFYSWDFYSTTSLTLPRGEGACRRWQYVGVQGPMQRPRKQGLATMPHLPSPPLPLVELSATPPTSRPASPEGGWQLGCLILKTGGLGVTQSRTGNEFERGDKLRKRWGAGYHVHGGASGVVTAGDSAASLMRSYGNHLHHFLRACIPLIHRLLEVSYTSTLSQVPWQDCCFSTTKKAT